MDEETRPCNPTHRYRTHVESDSGHAGACASAEGEGFEPSVDLTAHNGFRDRPVQPLRHPSEDA